ncbi:MAG: endonuclease, partial [Bacteroides sp.]|nr:endonuclease [Bacteroides sp.]
MFLPRSKRQISQHKEEYGNSRQRATVAMLFFTMKLIAVSFLAPSYAIAQDSHEDQGYHGTQAPSQQERIPFRVVSWNIETLFDTHHDSLKNAHEFLP